MENREITDPLKIATILHGDAQFQVIRAGIELGIFKILNENTGLDLNEVMELTHLCEHSAILQMDCMEKMGLVLRINGKYFNCEAIKKSFDSNEFEVICSMAGMYTYIMRPGQTNYVESLIQNKNIGLKNIPGIGETLYERLSNNLELNKIFYYYMETFSKFINPYLIKNLDLENVNNFLDVGGGGGNNAIAIAQKNQKMQVTLIDMPHVRGLAEDNFKKNGLDSRAKFHGGDFFKDEFPKDQDLITFIHQLVIWSPKQNKELLKKAYDSLNEDGRVVIFSSMGDHPKNSLTASLFSVYFKSLASGEGRMYPSRDYEKWLIDSGFSKVEIIPCDTWTPHMIVIGYK